MKALRAMLLGLVLGGAGLAASACSVNDYEPGIHNPGYTPGHGRTNYASLAAAPDGARPRPGNDNGAPAAASSLGSGVG